MGNKLTFDWQAEDTAVWEETESPPSHRPPKRRRWLWVTAGLSLLLLATAVLARAWQQRLDSVTSGIEADILASEAVVQTAVAQRDGEMLASVLSGQDETWASTMAQLAGESGFYERSGLGLMWLPDTAAAPPVITLTPDLRAAEVIQAMAYAIDVGHGLTETVVLQHTAVYRAGANRWLLSPPEADFWGEMRVASGQYLTFRFPARDTAVAERLLMQTDARLGAMCTQLPNFSCPDAYHLDVALSPEPAALAKANLPVVIASQTGALTLPAPTLAGLPSTEAGYQALFRGYASLILAAAITDMVEWRCCEQAVFYSAVLAELLHELGLRAEPPDEHMNSR